MVGSCHCQRPSPCGQVRVKQGLHRARTCAMSPVRGKSTKWVYDGHMMDTRKPRRDLSETTGILRWSKSCVVDLARCTADARRSTFLCCFASSRRSRVGQACYSSGSEPITNCIGPTAIVGFFTLPVCSGPVPPQPERSPMSNTTCKT